MARKDFAHGPPARSDIFNRCPAGPLHILQPAELNQRMRGEPVLALKRKAAGLLEKGKRAVYRGSLEQRTTPSSGSAAAVSGTKIVYVPIYAFDCE